MMCSPLGLHGLFKGELYLFQSYYWQYEIFLTVCLILNKTFNLFIAYNDVQPTIIFKMTSLASIQFEFETPDLE